MIGTVIMDISEHEMNAMVQYYLNRDLFTTAFGKNNHHATVVSVRQRPNKRFVIEFDGQPEPEFVVDEVVDHAASER